MLFLESENGTSINKAAIDATEKVFNAWALNETVTDIEIVDDVKSALYEAFIRGAQAAKVDSSIGEEAMEVDYDSIT